jgi:hypothetical protein
LPKGVGREKRLVAISTDLLTQLIEKANRQGKPFQVLLSQIISSGLKASENGRSVEEMTEFCDLMDTQRSSGGVLLPVDLCNYMISRLCETEKEKLVLEWRDAGAWYGKYLSSKFPNRDTAELLGSLLAATRWDLREVVFNREGESVNFRCIAPNLPDDSTQLLAAFVEGAMSSVNHKVVKSEVLRGMILQQFAR